MSVTTRRCIFWDTSRGDKYKGMIYAATKCSFVEIYSWVEHSLLLWMSVDEFYFIQYVPQTFVQ